MSWFKTKKQKEEELQAELNDLIIKYAEEINSYCKIYSYIFILKGFSIANNKICVEYIDKDTVEGCVNYIDLWWFEGKWGSIDFKKARFEFMRFKQDLKKIGLKLEKI